MQQALLSHEGYVEPIHNHSTDNAQSRIAVTECGNGEILGVRCFLCKSQQPIPMLLTSLKLAVKQQVVNFPNFQLCD